MDILVCEGNKNTRDIINVCLFLLIYSVIERERLKCISELGKWHLIKCVCVYVSGWDKTIGERKKKTMKLIQKFGSKNLKM